MNTGQINACLQGLRYKRFIFNASQQSESCSLDSILIFEPGMNSHHFFAQFSPVGMRNFFCEYPVKSAGLLNGIRSRAYRNILSICSRAYRNILSI